ncbi:MAG: hypothetical protein IPO92_17135 [Saprospiraceae bacterium]|nr:hypothetical protein [Saprospiraceae bacterium]
MMFLRQSIDLLLTLIVIILFCNQVVLAQPFPHIFFRNINEKNGLSSNNVSDITEDKDGFIWITTADGLNKYDGEKFTNYRKGAKNMLIIDNAINKIHIDGHQNMWLSYYNGVSKTNIKNSTDVFSMQDLTDVRMSWHNKKVYFSERKGVYEVDEKGSVVNKKGLIKPRIHNATSYNRLLDLYFFDQDIYSFLPNNILKLNDHFDIVRRVQITT